jgi:hypothetical protein
VAGLFSALSGLLVFVGTLLTMALSLQLPQAAQNGVFGLNLASELSRSFDGYSLWPNLVNRIVFVVAMALFAISTMMLVIARRRHGGFHQIRGLLAYFGLLAGSVTLRRGYDANTAWMSVAERLSARQGAAAMDAFMSSWNLGIFMLCGATILISVLLLAWPARRGGAVGASMHGSTLALDRKAGVA